MRERHSPMEEDGHMRALTVFDDLADLAHLYGLAFFATLIITLALMFGAALLFWTRCPDDVGL